MYDLITPTDIDGAFKDADSAPGSALVGVTTLIIPHISNQIAKFLRRELDKAEYTVYPDADGTRNIWLDAFPIDTGQTLEVYYDTAIPRAYGADTLLTDGEDYIVYANRGLIKLRYARVADDQAFKIIYTGGLLTGNAAGTPDTIKIPAILWAKRLVDQWETLGVLNQSFQGASVAYPPLAWIPRDIQEMLAPERRRLML